MKIALCLILAVCATAAKKPEAQTVTENRNPATALTVFHVAKPHTVKAAGKIAAYSLKVAPYASQTFKGQLHGGIRITWDLTNGGVLRLANVVGYSNVLIVTDGERKSFSGLDWEGNEVRQETVISNQELLHAIAKGSEVYITLQPDRDTNISFKLSEDQIADCRLIAEKYDSLRAGQ